MGVKRRGTSPVTNRLTDETVLHLKLLRATMKENTREEGEGLIKTVQFKTNFYSNSLSICQEEEASYHSM